MEIQTLKADQLPVTRLPKFTTELPFFYLTKQDKALKTIIRFSGQDAERRPISWEVKPGIEGAPGIDSHEVWIRLIKPAIDEQKTAEGELPPIIPLGRIRECLRKIGWSIGGFEQQRLISAIDKISEASCNADFWMQSRDIEQDGKPRFVRVSGKFSRMSIYKIGSVQFTEEEIRSKTYWNHLDLEQIICLRLDPLEVLIQQHQEQRPIDNEYLFSVGPSARRWYELLAAKFYGVATHANSPGFCEILYSWYVERHHTLKRHTERKRVVNQMNELVRDHIEFGYVLKVDYRKTFGPDGEVDFIIRYYPGEYAKISTDRIRSRLSKRKRKGREVDQLPLPISLPAPTLAKKSEPQEEQDELLKALLAHNVTESVARKLIEKEPREVISNQLQALSHRNERKNLAGTLVQAIRENWTLPDSFVEARERAESKKKSEERKLLISSCPFCRDKDGMRYRSNGVGRCTHNAEYESQFDKFN